VLNDEMNSRTTETCLTTTSLKETLLDFVSVVV
jgi:hypothetical protein